MTRRAAAGSAGDGASTIPAPPTTDEAATDVAASVAAIESNLDVVLGDAAAVETAYRRLADGVAGDPGLERQVHLRLASRLRDSRSRAVPALFACLAGRAPHLAEPGPILGAMLAARATELRDRALELVLDMTRQGRVPADLDLAAAVARAVAGAAAELAPGLGDRVLEFLASVTDARLPHPRGDPVGRLLEPSVPRALRVLAARLLDRAGQPAPPERARRVLGGRAAAELADYLAFTRARHEDLVDLAPGTTPVVRSLDSLRDAGEALGRDRLALLIAELGWARVADELSAEPITTLRIDGSFPFVLQPVEADLIEGRVPTGQRRDGWVVTARGREPEVEERAERSDDDRVDRFRRYSLNHAELLGEILEVAPVTVSRYRRIVGLLDRVVADHVALFAEVDPEAGEVEERYRRLLEAVELPGDGDADALLSRDAAYRIQAFEEPSALAETRTLHGLKRWLHQRGLGHAFRLFGSDTAANRSIDLVLLREGRPPERVRQIRYIDFDEPEGGDLPLAVRLVVEAFRAHLVHGVTRLPSVRILVYGNEAQVYIWFRNHPAFLRLDLSPPHRGGMIDLQYYAVSQYELGQHPDPTVPAIRNALRRLGFLVELDGTRLHARYDKERALDLADLLRTARLLLRLVPQLMDLDWSLDDLPAAASERADDRDDRIDFLLRFGLLPPGDAALPGTPGPDALRRLRRRFRELGLRPAAGLPIRDGGQAAVEAGLLVPFRAAVERGELVEVGDGRFRRAPRTRYRREHVAARLARLLAGPDDALAEAIAHARAIQPLGRWLSFRTTGTIQGWPVDRATLTLRDGDLTVAVLRDAAGVARLASVTRGRVPYRVRPRGQLRWERPADLSALEFLRRLERDNYRAPEAAASVEAADTPARIRALFREPAVRPPAPPIPGDGHVPGMPAAPGRASGFVRVGRAARDPAELEGAVLVARTLSPADAPLLTRCVAGVSTGGGTLSHVGLLALELGKPSLIVDGRWRRGADGRPCLLLRPTRIRRRSGRIRALAVDCWSEAREPVAELRDGMLVVVDADEATLRLVGEDREALALHQGLLDLETAARAVAAAAGEDARLLVARGSLIRVLHQLRRGIERIRRPSLAHYLVRELMAAQAAPGSAPATAERRKLLEEVCRNRAVRDAALAARDRGVNALIGRLESALDTAAAEVPLLDGPLEILFLRLTAARLREALHAVLELAGGERPTDERLARADRAAGLLDAAAVARLRTLRDRLERELVDGAAATPRTARALEAAAWIDRVVPTPAGGGTGSGDVAARLREVEAAELSREAAREVIPLDELQPCLAPLVGRKAASLGQIGRVLGPGMVPPGFVVAEAGFRAALASRTRCGFMAGEPTVEAAIRHVLDRTDLEPARRSAWIRDLWLHARFPGGLEEQVVAAYRALQRAGEEAPFVAVRSSALAEDTPTATRAGAFDTFLFVRGEDSLLHHLRLAWAGLWNPRSLHRAVAGGGAGRLAAGGILVQRMVDARVSGVVLTVDPASGSMRELVVNAGLGLGEGVVSGTVEADEVHVARGGTTGEPLRLRYRVADKRTRVALDEARGGGTRRVETLFHQRHRPALEYTEVESLVHAALTLERAYGEPLDLEFALEGPALRILQARPVPLFRTALAETLERFPLTETST